MAQLRRLLHLLPYHLKEGQGEHLAAAIYAGSFLVMSLVFPATQRHILFPRAHLLAREIDEDGRRLILRRAVSGAAPYVVATVLAAVSPYITLAICAAVPVFYALPFASASERAG